MTSDFELWHMMMPPSTSTTSAVFIQACSMDLPAGLWNVYYDGFCVGGGRLRLYIPKNRIHVAGPATFSTNGTCSFLLEGAFELLEGAKLEVQMASYSFYPAFEVKNPSLRVFKVGDVSPQEGSGPKQCNCDMTLLLRAGCKCGGE